MVKDSRFWIGFLVGLVAFYLYTHWMAKKGPAG